MNEQKQPVIAIYVGYGASHSWTWFADIFEKFGCYNVKFIDEADVEKGLLTDCNVFFISGGDTFAIAEGLGKPGAEEIERFVLNGGVYIGSCAGAYLPLRSSLKPLNNFNFVHSPITNLTKNLPVPVRKAEKFCTEYGCQYVFHPVREEVKIKFKGCYEDVVVNAPLYGGPGLLPSEDIEVLAVYQDFTEKTEFLIDEKTARETIIGSVAAAKKDAGQGTFFLFGPHFEHPDYEDANKILFDIIYNFASRSSQSITAHFTAEHTDPGRIKKLYKKFLSEVSNSRIIALSLERSSYKWLVGRKVYDPEKIRVFLETIWSRARVLDNKDAYPYINEVEIKELIEYLELIKETLRHLKNSQEQPDDSVKNATQLFFNLREATAKFLKIYFRYKNNSITDEQRRKQCTRINSISKQRHCSTPSL
jgi:glutamine amidotransferase-like uncharacterized protein